MKPYETGEDLYSQIASKVFKVPLEDCGDGTKYRKMSKVILLGMMYGISSFSLSETFGITPAEAEQLYEDFHGAYPVVSSWMKSVNQKANDLGFVETAWHRKRRFIGHRETASKYKRIMEIATQQLGKPAEEITRKDIYKLPYKIKSAYYEVNGEYQRVMRQSVNAVIQGSSADIMKLAMIKVNNHLKKKAQESGQVWRMIATIHDEVLLEIPATATAEEIQELADIQKSAVTLSVPMKVDVEISKRWGEGISFKDWKELKAQGKEF